MIEVSVRGGRLDKHNLEECDESKMCISCRTKSKARKVSFTFGVWWCVTENEIITMQKIRYRIS